MQQHQCMCFICSKTSPKNNCADSKRRRPLCPPPEPPTGIYVNAINPKMVVYDCDRTSMTNTPTKPEGVNGKVLRPGHPPPPPPRNFNIRKTSAQQESERWKSSQPRLENITPPVISPDEPLYTEVEEEAYLEILPEKDVMAQAALKPQITAPRQNVFNLNSSQNTHNQDAQELVEWMRTISKTTHVTPYLCELSKEDQIRVFNQRALNTKQVLHLFNILMTRRSQRLQSYISNFHSFSELLDKEKKMVKTMGIAGGTTGAVGGVAAVFGIALAPFTMGVSLAVTAVGVGMVGAAGGMGARASKATKKVGDRNTIENLVRNYMLDVADIEQCLKFILCEITEVQRHNLERLKQAGALPDALTVAHKLQSVINNINNGKNNVYTSGLSSVRLLCAFAPEMDQYFKEKGGQQRLRKSTKSRLSGRFQLLARNLQEELDYLNFVWQFL
ncbi:uncharacterized protein LOC119125440 isoform X2 [Syngnathus acus]|uniref:uncharacterized protein LOC119125440 isoform X2 n=1 Tax=Syngnathus acus TaxID=161584 RepID=UPI0018862223|nr:uncharacterized protein LOC119125440 isoform X2 [Syngnathus acus]XP_037111873.1 uncharacterized protein LOC119125440 isoform X2 [Syngnathus acus]